MSVLDGTAPAANLSCSINMAVLPAPSMLLCYEVVGFEAEELDPKPCRM